MRIALCADAFLRPRLLLFVDGKRAEGVSIIDRGAVPNRAPSNAARALGCDRVGAEVVGALQNAGIPAILLKGPSIAGWLYPSGGCTCVDTDLLVPAHEFSRAEAMLTSIGFTELLERFHPCELGAKPGVETAFSRRAELGLGPGGTLDPHRNLPMLRAPDEFLWEALSAETETFAIGEVELRVLGRVVPGNDAVVSLCFADGSLATICYGSALPKAGKEWIEVTSRSHRLVIDDFRWAQLHPGWQVLPFASKAFGAVVASSVLEYIADPSAVLHECRRVRAVGAPTRTASAVFRNIIGFSDPNQGFAESYPSEAYLNFGLIGCLGAGLFLGTLMEWAWRKHRMTETRPRDLLYPVLLAGLRSDALTQIEDVLYPMLAVWVLMGWYRVRYRRRPASRSDSDPSDALEAITGTLSNSYEGLMRADT